jgi:hypothetical protein
VVTSRQGGRWRREKKVGGERREIREREKGGSKTEDGLEIRKREEGGGRRKYRENGRGNRERERTD